MNQETVIRNARIVNEGKIIQADVLIKNGRIERIGQIPESNAKRIEVDAKGLYLLPGVVDDQVHFREPGLLHKGEIFTESRAAVTGGITSFMEMPNTVPQTVTQELLATKYEIGARQSMANYSFFMGATNTNLEEVLKTDGANVCGVKVFMGSSTGDMLVDNEKTLDAIFRNTPLLVATHCEVESIIRENLKLAIEKFGDAIPLAEHPYIRSREACLASSSMAVALAKKYNTRLHILHISTAEEVNLFSNELPLEKKRITAEACVHHLWFSEEDYAAKGSFIKWNPAIKKPSDRAAIRKGLLDNKIDIVATDHAPHTLEEKANPYLTCPSGGPLVQHALVAMLEFAHQGWITIERVVEKMSHAPAVCFQLAERGFIREGYYADLVLVDLSNPWTVSPSNVLYKCGWSPFEGTTFKSKVMKTFINGVLVFDEGKIDESYRGMRLHFNRNN
ncbi:dihydroorotase [soil metagenome]